ncbi:DUF5719 family protein [Streptomyces sp. DSM 44917]|uniref:DUF5719 family protein n=1 Tax=Streptomyces boetiae TaxID=3075541 RepID=A0ABU2LF65_9ACTN|nr:DUF5719 family protein [Streptomyces sp. DSM 44917]MDT0310234.1 DUF5719 family protein [Streptomyces sp. DSM 44917]
MNSAPRSLLVAVLALAALTGLAGLRPGEAGEVAAPDQGPPRPVERVTLTCPRPTGSDTATTWYTAYTPPGEGSGEDGDGEEPSAFLLPAPEYVPGTETPPAGGEDAEENAPEQEEQEGAAEPFLALGEPGAPATARVGDADAPALAGTAHGALAPGWTVQQSTSVPSGPGRGLLGTSCQAPDTQFWFAGASTADSRADYVHLTNPDEEATVVDIDLYGAEGRLTADAGQGITVPGGASVPVRLSTLGAGTHDDLAVRVTARTGRIGAQVEAVDEALGADWLPPAAAPAGTAVLPGIPAEARSVRLVVFVPGEEDATLDVGLASPSGTLTPAGFETVSVRAGSLTSVDLRNVTQGEAGSLILTPSDESRAVPLAAAALVTIGDGEEAARELAFIPATPAVERRATVTGNTASGTTLSLTAPGEAAEVDVTLSAGTDGGEPVTESYTVPAGSTLAVTPEPPEGTSGFYSLTVETRGGTVHAARTLTSGEGGDTSLTIQTLPDDRSAVSVPETEQDLSVLTR